MNRVLSKFRIRFIRDSEANWNTNNPVLLNGELAVVTTSEGTKLKIGNGVSSFTNLPYLCSPLEKLKNKVQTILGYETNQTTYPTTAAVYDLIKPYAIYATDGTTGLTALNKGIDDVSWQLNLDVTPFRRLKFYVKSGGNSANYETCPTVVEMVLEPRGSFDGITNNFVASSVTQHANDNNRLFACTFAVSNDKTKIAFLRATSLSGSLASDYSGNNRFCYLIEGYLV